MHILDGVLSLPVTAVTTAAAVGLIAWSIKGIREPEVPKIALMSAAFFAGSMIHVNIGGSSVHLLLSGLIGLILGRRTPVAISISLLLQWVILQFGGLTSFGANVIDVSVPAILIAALVRPRLGQKRVSDLIWGAAAGVAGVVLTVILVSLMLLESNIRFGFGPFSAIRGLMVGHLPVMFIEAPVTAFATAMIVRVRPELLISERRRADRQGRA